MGKSSNGFFLDCELDMSLDVKIEQWALADTVTILDESVGASAKGGTNGFDFQLGSRREDRKSCVGYN
jgi:hypothetical protein